MGTGGRSVLARFASTPIGSTVTSFLALFIARFPTLLGPLHAVFPVGSAAPRVPSSGTGSIIRLFRPGALAGWKGVAIAVATAAIMVTSGLSISPLVPFSLHSGPIPDAAQAGNVNTTLFYPYLVSPSLYPSPANLSILNFSQPQLASTVIGANPTFFLLASGTTPDGTPGLYLEQGYYEPSLARESRNGTLACHPGHGGKGKGGSCGPAPTLPIAWTVESAIPTFRNASLDGDALAANNTTVVVAGSVAGTTTVWMSTDAGENWTQLGSSPGDHPHVAFSGSRILLTSSTSTGTEATSFSLNNSFSPHGVLLGGATQALPLLLPNNTEVVVASNDTQASVASFTSQDNGTTFTAHPVENYTQESVSPIFNSIGGPIGATSLSVPGGIPGQIAAASIGPEIFFLYTSSVGGRVVGETMISADAGGNWTGPYFSAPSLGSVEDPVATASPEGYFYVTWRENGQGIWAVDQSVYGANGLQIQAPSAVPTGATSALGSPALAIDSLFRPLYVWGTNTSGTTQGYFTGDFLSPSNVSTVWMEGVANLTSADMVGGQGNLSSALIAKLQALAQMTGAGATTGAIEKIEQDLYPKVTGLPLTLLCEGGNPVCGHVHQGANPAWVVNTTGIMAPQTYLAVYADWALEALGVGVLTPLPGDASVSVDGASLTVTTLVMNPTATLFNSSYTFPVFSDLHTVKFSCFSTGAIRQVSFEVGNESVVERTGASVQVASQSFSLKTGLSATNFFATNMSANTQYDWSMTLTGYYQQTGYWEKEVGDTCVFDRESSTFPTTLSPASIAIPISGSFSTVMKMIPKPPHITSPSQGTIDFHWVNTMLPSIFSYVCLSGNGYSCGFLSNGYQFCYGDCSFTGVPDGTYTASGTVSSWPGTPYYPLSNTYLTPALSLGVTYAIPPTLTDSFSCTFDLQSNPIHLWGAGVVDVSASGATVLWNSSLPAPATLRYYALGTGVNQTLGPTALPTTGNGSVEYEVPLVALSTLSAYVGVISETIPGQGCLTYASTTSVHFGTPGVVTLHEHDLPYDSISQEGGGAQVYFTLPQYFAAHSQLVSGSLTVTLPDGTNPVNLPGAAFTSGNYGYVSTTVSTLTPNTAYVMSMLLNYSQSGTTVRVVAPALPFVYLKDTSGDGLSDAEKSFGWGVTFADSGGYFHGEHVTAVASDYSTNGLVSDYVEKEFGLDPRTIDTTGSHMLDTWNLTFDLGSSPLPSGYFHYWYENGSNPFAACPAPSFSGPCSYSPSTSNELSNITYANGADDSPWASEQLWSPTALAKLEGLVSTESGAYGPVGWLRAVTGTYDKERTITVWGKLSWGANPLARSTPYDGIPDGARVNPLHEVDLQIQLPSVSVTGSNFADGDGFAVGFYVNATSACGDSFFSCDLLPSNQWHPEFQGYSSEGFLLSGSGSFNNYFFTAPVSQTEQFQSVAFNLTLNTATCTPASTGLKSPCGKGQSPYALQNLPAMGPNLPFLQDMLYPANNNFYQGMCNGGVCADVTFVPDVKSRTYLWVPDDNSSLSNLPAGLQRYTGEQDFFLVVANFSSLSTSTTVPDPWGAPYTVNSPFAPSTVNFLVPRGQFLGSAMGQALFNQSPLSSDITHVDEITGKSLPWLACYWQGHAVAPNGYQFPDGSSSSGPTLCGSQSGTWAQGTDPSDPFFVSTIADSQNCTLDSSAPNCQLGGVPSNGQLEASHPAPALQGVVMLNLTSASDLNDLLAGLMDNTTVGPQGTYGVNGRFEDVTSVLPTLGLNAAVMTALSTSSPFSNGGVFGLPISLAQLPPPPPPSCNGWGCAWNTLSGVVMSLGTVIVAGLVGIAGKVWSAAIGAGAYFDHAVQGLSAYAEQAADAAVSALETVGQALSQILKALALALERFVVSTLSKLWDVIVSTMETYANEIVHSWRESMSNEYAYLNDTSNPNLFSVLSAGSLSLMLSFVGLGGIGDLVNTIESAVTALQPVLQFVNIVTVMELVLKALSFIGPLSTAAGSVNSLFNSGESIVGNSMAYLMNSLLGFSQPVPSSAALPGYFPPISNSVSAVEGSSETPGFASILIQGIVQYDGPILDLADLIVPALATAMFMGFLGHALLKKTGTLATAITEWVFDIVLTIGSWVFYVLATTISNAAGRIVFDALSIGFAVVSWILNFVEVLGGEAKTMPLLILYLLDVSSNVLDIAASGCDIAGQVGHPCPAP